MPRFRSLFVIVLALVASVLPWSPSTVQAQSEPVLCAGLVATIVGTEEDDFLQGTWQDDVIVGLGGNDTITGASGADTICAGDGDDTINGESGADVIDGGAGNDTINGQSQNDIIRGGDGDDTINGDSGDDTLDGGNGFDIVDGSWGTDTCDDAETAPNCETITTNGEGDSDGVPGEPILCDGLVATIVGTDGDDVLQGTWQDDVIVGLGGNDTINGDSGADTICAGDGDDIVNGQGQDDRIFGEAGNDTINGDSGADTIDGGPGNDTIGGQSQNDTIHGRNGDDNINGGPGEDDIDGGNGIDIGDGSWQNDTCDDFETAINCETETANGEPALDPLGNPLPLLPRDVEVAFGPGSTATIADLSVGQDTEASLSAAARQVSLSWDFNLPADKDFTTADLTIKYYPEAVEAEFDESLMQILFFDRELRLWVPAGENQIVDVDANTVTTTVDHFSIYAVFALGPDGFAEYGTEFLTATCLPADSDTGFDIVFAIDTSGSMRGTDRSGLRVTGAEALLDNMRPQDRAAVVTFDSRATRWTDLVELDTDAGITEVRNALARGRRASGGTSISAAVSESTNVFLDDDQTGRVRLTILLTDGQSSYNNQLTVDAADNGITIATIGLGTGSASTLLESIADGTGGRFVQLTSASQLPALYESFSTDLFDDGTNSDSDDGDTLTDCQERNGVITTDSLYTGELVTTDPNTGFSDDDSLVDSDELVELDLRNTAAGALFYPYVLEAGIETIYVMKSDPNDENSDGDDLDDDTEVELQTDPLDWDTDDDRISDSREVNVLESDPLDVFSPLQIDPTIVDLETPLVMIPSGLDNLLYFDRSYAEFTLEMFVPAGIDGGGDPFGNTFTQEWRLDGEPRSFDPDSGLCVRGECSEFWAQAEDETSSSEAFCNAAGLGTGIFNFFIPGGDCNTAEERVRYLLKDYLAYQGMFTLDGEFAPGLAYVITADGCSLLAEDPSQCTPSYLAQFAEFATTALELGTALIDILDNIPGGRRVADDDGFEEAQLRCHDVPSNSRTRRPTQQELDDPRFAEIVGEPKLTPNGQQRGTIFDSTGKGSNWEMKGGSSQLSADYQLRLQIFFSVFDGTPYKLVTSRPLSGPLAALVARAGSIVAPC